MFVIWSALRRLRDKEMQVNANDSCCSFCNNTVHHIFCPQTKNVDVGPQSDFPAVSVEIKLILIEIIKVFLQPQLFTEHVTHS
jgi:hypothetical protein